MFLEHSESVQVKHNKIITNLRFIEMKINDIKNKFIFAQMKLGV